MSPAQLFSEGVNLMLSGMGFVLVFLLILIWAIELISKLINTFFPEPSQPTKTEQKPTALSDDVTRLRPVIIAAIEHHRRSQGLN